MYTMSATLILASLALTAAGSVPEGAEPEQAGANLLARSRAGGDEGNQLQEDLAAVLEEVEGGEDFRETAASDVPALEAELRTTFVSLPKNEGGRLGPTAVSYVLHRLFLKRYGWQVKGLDPEGKAWNSTSPARIPLLAAAPAGARILVERQLEGPGMDARGVATLAALIEHLLHQDASDRLRDVYDLASLPQDVPSDAKAVSRAMEIYAASYVIGLDPVAYNWSELTLNWATMGEVYPNWGKVQGSVRALMRAQARDNLTSFEGSAKALHEIDQSFGHWQASECQAMKDGLMKMEDRGSGRVRLADFYSKALHEGRWQLSESRPYLRQLGALDESNPGNVRVIMANYVLGASNCLATTPYLSVCCMSECEHVLGAMEASLGAPEATPQQVLTLVAAVNTSTVPVGHRLSPVMHHRLNTIAAANDGMVPLHGRLFAQWLHHAFPRECPYPHLAGSTRPRHTEDWLMATGTDYIATPFEMQEHAGAVPSTKPRHGPSRPLETAPWSYQEELFVPRHASAHGRPMALWMVHGATIAALGAISAFGLIILRTARTARLAARQAQVPAEVSKLYAV